MHENVAIWVGNSQTLAVRTSTVQASVLTLPGAAPAPTSRSAKAWRSGTHRSRTPDETLSHLLPLLPRFGITRVANLSGLDRIGLPVVAVCRPNARSSAVFHGKGVDLVAAKVSGIMEAVETWHAETVQVPLRFGSAEDLRPCVALIDTDGLPRRSTAAFSPDTPLLWVEGRDLLSEASTWLPFEIVHAAFTVDGPPATGCFAMTTNGLASGNTLGEAVGHALCEVIERDASALWRASPTTRRAERRLDLGGVRDDLCTSVLDRYARAGLDVAVWDVTTDVGVPAFQCLISDASGDTGHIGSGAGCHPARDIALLRALTEAAQVRMTYIAGSREDLVPDDYAAATLRGRHEAVARLMEGGPGTRAFERCPTFVSDTPEDDVAWLLERLRDAGLRQAAVVDLSRPGFDLSVVRVVVPFLEGSDHARDFVPGGRARRAAEA